MKNNEWLILIALVELNVQIMGLIIKVIELKIDPNRRE